MKLNPNCKVDPVTCHGSTEGCIAVLLTSVLGVEWSTSAFGCFISGKETRCALFRGLSGPQGLCGHSVYAVVAGKGRFQAGGYERVTESDWRNAADPCQATLRAE